MQPLWCIQQLEHNGKAIVALAAGVTEEQSRQRPAPGEWSMLQVLQHLVSEERVDFRKLLGQALGQPLTPLDLYDDTRPVSTLPRKVDHFRRERQHSLTWLRSLRVSDWSVRASSSRGRRPAGDLLSAWVAHDLLHVRQLVEIKFAITRTASEPYRVTYAGKW